MDVKMDVEGSSPLSQVHGSVSASRSKSLLNMCGIFISCPKEFGPSDGVAVPLAELSQSTKTLTQLEYAAVSRFLERGREREGTKG
eukprot:Skav200848  [mRNA]  locus=scaffold2131:216163:216420:- [translate_table: standard]